MGEQLSLPCANRLTDTPGHAECLSALRIVKHHRFQFLTLHASIDGKSHRSSGPLNM